MARWCRVLAHGHGRMGGLLTRQIIQGWKVEYGMVAFGMVEYGMVVYGMVEYHMVVY